MSRAFAAFALLLLVGGPAAADPPGGRPRHRRGHAAAAASGVPRNEPMALEPLIAIVTTPRKNIHLGLGVASLEVGDVSATSLAFTTGYTYAPSNGDFSLDMELPIGSVGGFLLGDIAFDFRWRALATPNRTRVALGFGFVLPSSLINSLGGNSDEIAVRRMEEDVYDELDLLPIVYWNMTPYFALSQRAGPILVTADAGLAFLLASKERNHYESPRPEFAVRYDLAISALIVKEMLSAIVELNGLSWVTDRSGDLKDGPTRDMGTGLTLTFGSRFAPDEHVQIAAGLQVPLAGSPKSGVFDLTNLYFHELSFVAEVRFVLPG